MAIQTVDALDNSLKQLRIVQAVTQAELDKVALRLNQRPRKTLGFETPASRLRASVATTH